MDKFYVITNSGKDAGGIVSKEIADYIKLNGRACILEGEGELTSDVDCVLVLGGDGTLLRAARELVDKNIPLLGINLGTLGYLAEIDRHSIYPALDKLFAGDYSLEDRMMLTGTVYHEGKPIYTDIALNDIVITREGPMRVVRFKNYVNGAFLNEYRADGVIISTATGSTGYSLSAGGPIVSPTANMIMMTPLAPHALNRRSIIFPAEDQVMVEVGPGREPLPDMASANFDGEGRCAMVTGDRIVIQRTEKITRLVKINNISFLEVLRRKMSEK